MGDILKEIESQGLSKTEVSFLIDILDELDEEFKESGEEFEELREKYNHLMNDPKGISHREDCEDCAAFCVRFRKVEKTFTDTDKEHEVALKIRDKLKIMNRNR